MHSLAFGSLGSFIVFVLTKVITNYCRYKLLSRLPLTPS
jgi:hypothetical protein